MNTPSLIHGFLSLQMNGVKSRRSMLALQDRKLRGMLAYAFERSAYYRESFIKAGISRENLTTLPLTAFPVLDKRTLIERFDQLVTVPELNQAALRRFDSEQALGQKVYLGRYHVVHSSGSTGAPAYFVYDQAAWDTMLLGILRGALWDMSLAQIIRLLAGRPRVLYVAATDGRYGGAMAVGDGIDGVGAHQLFLDINTPLDEWAKQIRAFQPNMVIGYPSAVKILADLAQKRYVELELLRVVTCGEPLTPGMRTYLEQALHTGVVNFYGASESLALGVEGAGENDMTLFDDLNVIESVNGNMYVTCLYNFAQPLIRYRISDCLTLKASTPDAFTHANLLLSRSEDMLWFEDGCGHRDFIHPLAVEGFCLQGLRDYQFIQMDRDGFAMLAVADAGRQEQISASMYAMMQRILHEKRLDWVRFEMRFTDEIASDKRTGKKQLIISSAT